MQQEIIFSVLIILIIFYILNYDSRIEVETLEDNNGETYKVKVRPGTSEIVKKKVEFLKELNDISHFIVKKMYDEKYPNKEICTRVYNRFKNTIINETPPNDNGAAYTINKGPINICIEKKDGTFHDINDAIFVILHELAHVMSISYGHGPEFQQNFDYIVKYAIKNGIWHDKQYESNNTDYCGVKITSSPCDNNECSKNNLDRFFKESLLDN